MVETITSHLPKRLEQAMNETCDRCGPAVGAAYCVERVGQLYFCRTCANRLWPALWAQGWTIWLTGGRGSRRTLRSGLRLRRQPSPEN
jgi:hypothetical protein